MTGVLDSPEAYARLDPSGLGQRIASMPLQCRDAWVKAQAFALPDSYSRAQRILVLGMGGSAIGGDLLAGLQEMQAGVPVEVHRGYGKPSPADDQTLVIASSYSGNTEETLVAFERSWQPGVKAIAATHGGALATRARVLGVPLFPIEVEGEPRSVMGYSLFALLGFVQRLGLAPDRSADVAEAFKLMQAMTADLAPDRPAGQNAAKALAMRATDKAVLILGAQHLEAVARRWKAQIAENAKHLAVSESLPEWDHNGVEGLHFPPGAAPHDLYVILESALYHPRIALRCRLTRRLLEENRCAWDTYAASGKSPLAQVMTATLFGDYVSYYLAILNGVDPSATPNLDRFKKLMADQ